MQPRVRSNALTGYAHLASSVGLDRAAMMAGAGVEPGALDVADRWLPGPPVARLLETSAAASDCEDFGLRLAAVRRLGTLGPLAVVLREEPDLRSVLDLLVRYERVYNEALHLRLDEGEGEGTVSVRAWLEFGEPVAQDQSLDLVLGALVGIIRSLVDPGWMPLSVALARPPPVDPGPWQTLFGVVAFGQRSTSLVVRAGDLRAPVRASDASLRPYTQQFLRTTLAPPGDGATTDGAQVVEALELLLPLGRHSMAQVSRQLGIPPRALQRRLAEHGETFSSLLQTTRLRLAEQYLPNERYSLTELSQLLGFAAPSAFTRWFRQVFGSSPTEWRRSIRADPGRRPTD
jgi:AraC-like DNA-binding protein